MLAGARGGGADGPLTGTSRWARTATTSRRSSDTLRSSSRSTTGCLAPSARTRSTSARSPAGPRSTDRSSRSRRHRPSDLDAADRCPRRRAHPRRRHDPGRHRRRSRTRSSRALRDHRDLGVHTELLSDALVDLIERGRGDRQLASGWLAARSVTTFALGTQRLYDFLDENSAVEFLPVDHVNDPRVIAEEDCFVSINATTEVDLGRAVRVGDGRRSLLVLQRRPGRLRPRRDVLTSRDGVRRAARRRPPAATVSRIRCDASRRDRWSPP